MGRKGVGRKSIPMKKIENQSKLEVTFSKRRSGIYKKASELCLRCDCQVAIVILSAANRIYSFGDPSAEQVLNSFINRTPQQESMVQHLMKSNNSSKLHEEMILYRAIIEAEKTREKTVNEQFNDPHFKDCFQKWWVTPVEELTLGEAEEMLAELEFKYSIDTYHIPAQTSPSHKTRESPCVPCSGDFRLSPRTCLASSSLQDFENKGGYEQLKAMKGKSTTTKELIADDIDCVIVDRPPPEEKGPWSCVLAVDNIDNKVAFGLVFGDEDITSKSVHGVPLQPGCLRVSVDGSIKPDALVPVPIAGEIEKVHQAVGSYLAWPRNLIIFPSVTKKRKEVLWSKRDELQRVQALFNNAQPKRNVPNRFKKLV